MSIQPQAINEFLENKVKDGSCSSVVDGAREVISQLIEKDIDRRIEEGERQIENGDYEILDGKFIDRFIADAARRLKVAA